MNLAHFKNALYKTASQKTVWTGIVGLILALVIFQAGIFVGFHKASFSYGSGDNFHRMFGAPERNGMMGLDGFGGFPGGELTSAYGTTGTIVKITLPTIVVAGSDKVEKVVVVNEQTILRQFRDDINNNDLKVGDSIIVIGAPNSSSTQIVAKLIRVLPEASSTMMRAR